MTALLRAEALKLRTLLLPRLMLALAALGGGFLGFAVVRIARDEHTTVSPKALATAAAQPLWFLAVIVAVLATAAEFQHRTIHSTLLQAPRRGRVLAAKTLIAAAYAAILTLTGTICAFGVGILTMKIGAMPIGPIQPSVLVTIAGSVIIGALWAILAAGLGMLARNTAIALVALLLWRFVLEGLVPVVITRPDLRPWLPSGAADALLFGRAELLPPLGGGLLFAAYAAIVTLAGARILIRWDA
jgi:ABC-2 type transport system permease protein